MPTMSLLEALLCRSAPWRCLSRRILPWSMRGFSLAGEVLEIGGGNGAMAAALGRTNPQVRLTVTDLDPVMVRTARRQLVQQPHVLVHQADATRLPYGNESFDVVTSFLMLHHVVDWETAVSEASRVLRPGGMSLGYDLVASRVASLVHLVDRSPHRLIERETLEPVLMHVGFQAVTVQYSLRGLVLRFAARKPGPPQPLERSTPLTWTDQAAKGRYPQSRGAESRRTSGRERASRTRDRSHVRDLTTAIPSINSTG